MHFSLMGLLVMLFWIVIVWVIVWGIRQIRGIPSFVITIAYVLATILTLFLLARGFGLPVG